MLFPERDESRPLGRVPIVLVIIVAANVIVFFVQPILRNSVILLYSLKPAETARGQHLEPLVTSMFMHANVLHILGNMIYLWVFGDELEANYLGSIRLALFYTLCGVA